MLVRDETLTWGNDHWLRIWQDSNGCHAMLGVIKKPHSQGLDFEVPNAITIEMILAAWEKQGRVWIDVCRPIEQDGHFVVVRKIDLGEFSIFWFVHHFNDYPLDACAILRNPPANQLE